MSTCTLNHSALESRGFDAPPVAALALRVPLAPTFPVGQPPQSEALAPVSVCVDTDPQALGDWGLGMQPVVTGERCADNIEVARVLTAPRPQEPAASAPELALDRPPQLREAAALPVVVIGSDFAGPSELRQLCCGSSGGSDPEKCSATVPPEPPQDKDPARIGPSRVPIVGLAARLGLIVRHLSWVASSAEKKIDDGWDQSAANLHHPKARASESGAASPGADTGTADSEAPAGTGGMGIIPEVEAVQLDPQPKPPKVGHDEPPVGARAQPNGPSRVMGTIGTITPAVGVATRLKQDGFSKKVTIPTLDSYPEGAPAPSDRRSTTSSEVDRSFFTHSEEINAQPRSGKLATRQPIFMATLDRFRGRGRALNEVA